MQYKETLGNTELLKLPKTTFLRSRQAPASAVLRCYDWALVCTQRMVCVQKMLEKGRYQQNGLGN